MQATWIHWRFWGVLVVLIALLPSAYLAWTWQSMPHLGAHYDDAAYFATAKSWASGSGHRLVSMPGSPLQTKYPPLYPLLLSVVWRLSPEFPANLPLAMALSWLALPLVALAAWRYYEDLGLGPWRTPLLVAFLVLTPVITTFSLFIMSELVFTALLVGAVVAADRATRSDGVRWAMLAGLLGAAAYLTRSAALPFLGTATVCFLLRRRWREAGVFTAVMGPVVVAWQWWVRTNLPAADDVITLYHTNYVGFHFLNVNWETLSAVVMANVNTILSGVGALFLFSEDPSLLTVTLQRLATVGAVVGAVRLARRKGNLNYPLYAAAYGLILIQWHYPPKERFLLPLAPLLLAGLLTEAEHLFAAIRRNFNQPKLPERIVASAMGLGLLAFGVLAVYQVGHGHLSFLPAYFAHQESLKARRAPAYQWVRDTSAPDTQYFADMDSAFYLYTGRQACSLRVPPVLIVTDDQEEIRRLLLSLPRLAKQFDLQRAFLTDSDYALEARQLGGETLADLFADEDRFPTLYHRGGHSVHQFSPASGHVARLVPPSPAKDGAAASSAAAAR